MPLPSLRADAAVATVEPAEVQQRTLRVLWISAVLTRGAVSSIFPVSVLAIKDLLGSETWAGLSTGASTVGSALCAGLLAGFMQRRGRNLGLASGFGAAALGAVLCIVAIQADMLILFLVSMVLVGVGSGTSHLARYTAADLATDESRSRDIGSVIFAATFGAVFFPLLIGVAGDLSEDAGLDANTGGFFLGLILLVLGGGAIWLFMRPDPLFVAESLGQEVEAGKAKRNVTLQAAMKTIWAHPLARLAFVALVISQAVMVMVMAMTPLHMEDHGHSKGAVGFVISAHTAGMFAFAPLAGRLSDRLGRVPTIAVAGATLIVATTFTAFAGEAPRLLLVPGLFLLGLGWSFGIVAGSALLTESVEADDRVAAQGVSDVAMNIASGVGALSSGVVLSTTGFHILSMIGMVAAGAMLINAYFQNRLATLRY